MRVKFQNKRGQVTVEYILLAVVLISLFQIATVTLRDNDYLKGFQETPNKIFMNLVENGNWETDVVKSRSLHPGHHDHHYTSDGKGP